MIADRTTTTVSRWLTVNNDLVKVVRSTCVSGSPLAHSDLDGLAHPVAVRHFRQQLIAAGLLPERHHHLALFDEWVDTFVADIDNPAHRHTIATYARWSQRRRLKRAVDSGTFRAASTRVARRYIRMALTFVEWLDKRGVDLEDCAQSDVDRWFAGGNTNRWSMLNFFRWTQEQRLTDRRLTLPVYRTVTPVGMTTDERAAIVAILLANETIPLLDRVAGLFVCVYAQPVTRVSRIRRSDVTVTPTAVEIDIGAQRIVLADQIGILVARLVDGGEVDEVWLFAGRTRGQPRSSHSLSERVRRHGVTGAARISALHDLARKVPSPILAGLIGYNPFVIAARSNALGAPWEYYAALQLRRRGELGEHP